MSEEEQEAIYELEDIRFEERINKKIGIVLNLIDKLQKENEELSESNFHFLEINQKLIEEKPIIKELEEKELKLLEQLNDYLKKILDIKNLLIDFIPQNIYEVELKTKILNIIRGDNND